MTTEATRPQVRGQLVDAPTRPPPAVTGPLEGTATRPPAGGHRAQRVPLLDRLSPGPTRASDVAYLDGVRACAVLLVVTYHAWLAGGSPLVRVFGVDLTFVPETMGVGVTLFFLLSGFLLARPWFAAELTGTRRPSVKRFWRRRIARIVPAYYLSIAVALLLFLPSGRIPGTAVRGQLGFENVGGQLLFLQGYLPVSSGNLNGVDGAYWTLSAEMTLYLLLPATVLLFAGRRWWLTVPAALLAAVGWVYLSLDSLGPLVHLMARSVAGSTSSTLWVPATTDQMRNLLLLAFPAWTFVFALGIGLARLAAVHALRTGRGEPPPWWQRPDVARLALCGGAGLFGYGQYRIGTASVDHDPSRLWLNYLSQIVPAAGLTLVLFGLTVGPGRWRRPLEWRPLRYVGWVSYGVYLYHLPLIQLLQQHTGVERLHPGPRAAVILGAALVLSLAAGTASWMLVERPLLRRRAAPARSRVRPTRTVAAVTTGALAAGVLVGWTRPAPPVGVSSAVGMFAKAVPGARADPSHSGPSTLPRAAEQQLVYPKENELLRRCGAQRGETALLVGVGWSVSATAFACRDGAEAGSVVTGLAAWEPTIGYARTAVAGQPGAVFYRGTDAPTPSYPAQFHARFAAGGWVVGFAVQARSPATGRHALAELTACLGTRYRPSG